MVAGHKRSTRSTVQKSPAPSTASAGSSKTPLPLKDASEVEPVHSDIDESCPACKDDVVPEGVRESWIRCDACKTWFHWRCAGNGEDPEMINKW
jgi:hypothetical protein